MSDALVTFSEVSKTFRTGFLMRPQRVLEKLSLRVEAGHVYGLLGPNGAGKTTTLKLLMGLLRTDAGEVRVLGLQWLRA